MLFALARSEDSPEAIKFCLLALVLGLHTDAMELFGIQELAAWFSCLAAHAGRAEFDNLEQRFNRLLKRLQRSG